MEAEADFQTVLTEALFNKREHLDRHALPVLKDQFRVFQTGFQGIYKILLRKSMVQEDPYRLDKKLSEVTIPSKDPFGESSRFEQLSLRLSDYDAQLEFINSYYNFTVEFLNMERIKLLAELLKYYRWDQLTESSSNLNTRVLAEAVGRIKQGGDQLSINLIADALNVLDRATKKIMAILKEVSDYHRESYKLEFRQTVLSYLNITPDQLRDRMDDVLQQVKRKFSANMGDKPFYQALIIEVLQGEFGSERDRLRGELMQKIAVKEDQPKKKKKEAAFKTILLDGIRIMSSASIHMEAAMRKLDEANLLLINRKLSFGERFRRWVMNIGGKQDEDQYYDVEFFDTKTGTTQTERINFTKFKVEVENKARLFGALASKVTSQYKRLESSPEDQVFQFFSRNLESLQVILKRLPALDTYFKSEIPKEQRNLIRGVKIEMNGIKNAYIKANQKKHEYVSKKEEQEQLKKLGINPQE